MVVAGVVLCAVLGTALAFGIRADAERTDARQIATRSRKVSDATADLLKSVLDLQAGLRGYALTGSRAFLEPSERARAPLSSQTASLLRLSAGAPPARRRLARGLVARTRSYEVGYTVPFGRQVARGHASRAWLAGATIEGKRRVDELALPLLADAAGDTPWSAEGARQPGRQPEPVPACWAGCNRYWPAGKAPAPPAADGCRPTHHSAVHHELTEQY